MGALLQIHGILGERVLPLLILIVGIWLAVSWRPNAPANPATRFFPILVDIQVLIGIILFVYLLVGGKTTLLGFPFILHPILGLVASFVAHRGVRGAGLLPALGRWSAAASLGILLVIVIINIVVAMQTA
jgi:hypothetical protein